MKTIGTLLEKLKGSIHLFFWNDGDVFCSGILIPLNTSSVQCLVSWYCLCTSSSIVIEIVSYSLSIYKEELINYFSFWRVKRPDKARAMESLTVWLLMWVWKSHSNSVDLQCRVVAKWKFLHFTVYYHWFMRQGF